MVCFILPPPPQPLQAVCWVRTLWPRWGTPWGLGRESLSGCSKVERDSCTADPAVVVRAALGVHDCHRRPQQRARGLHDKETCCLFAKTDNHCSIRWEPWGELVPKTGANSRIIKWNNMENNFWPFKHLLLYSHLEDYIASKPFQAISMTIMHKAHDSCLIGFEYTALNV